MKAENLNEALNSGFSALTEANKKSVIEMTEFLVLAQDSIVPGILSPNTIYQHKKKRKNLSETPKNMTGDNVNT